MNTVNDKEHSMNKGIQESVKKAMIKTYGLGEVTFHLSANGGHFVRHEDDYGDLYSHQYDPKTGRVEPNPSTTSHYYD